MRVVLPVLLLLAWSHAAKAMMPPYVYEEARLDAGLHVQIEVTRTVLPRRTPGDCRITGRVVGIFRSAGSALALGSEISFDAKCLRPDDEVPPSGILWTDAGKLEGARYIEAFLNERSGEDPDPRYVLAEHQFAIIPAPSPEPLCPADKPGIGCR